MSRTPLQVCSEYKVQNALAENLRLFRQSRGWSMAKLARITGCSRDTIFRIEDRRNSPKLATFMSLCLAFEVGPETLLGAPEDFRLEGE